MAFKREEVAELLAKCRRRCCICYRFCGTKIETDHIEQRATSHDDTIENAIPVCFECHAEIHAYNPEHPRGRKFTADELRKHKAQWLKVCENQPETLITASHLVDVGPLEALLSEIEFNTQLAGTERKQESNPEPPPMLFIEQFERAIQCGAILLLDEKTKSSLFSAYASLLHANQQTDYSLRQGFDGYKASSTIYRAYNAHKRAAIVLQEALDQLRKHLGYNA